MFILQTFTENWSLLSQGQGKIIKKFKEQSLLLGWVGGWAKNWLIRMPNVMFEILFLFLFLSHLGLVMEFRMY